jgi:hypothetical protein
MICKCGFKILELFQGTSCPKCDRFAFPIKKNGLLVLEMRRRRYH